MRKLFILAVLLMLASCDDQELTGCKYGSMTFSDALPIQIWQIGCLTYNEQVPKGVHKACFSAPFSCASFLKLQFSADATESTGPFYLNIYDESDNLVDNIEFTPSGQGEQPDIEFENSFFDININPWASFIGSDAAVAQAFIFRAPGYATADATSTGSAAGYENSRYLAQYREGGWPIGDYTITFRARNESNYSGSGGSDLGISVFSMPDGNSQVLIPGQTSSGTLPWESFFPPSGIFYDIVLNFTLTESTPYLAFRVLRQGSGGSFDIKCDVDFIRIDSAPTLYDSYVYTVEADIAHYIEIGALSCGGKFWVEIIDPSSSPEQVGKSDLIQLVDTSGSDPYISIRYHNNGINYNGLVYADVSPDTIFEATVPAIFFHDRHLMEVESIELSQDEIVTSSTIKHQVLLNTDYVPNYMHAKILYILAHKSVEINDKFWRLIESYSKTDGDRRWPHKSASVYLTEANSVVRNV